MADPLLGGIPTTQLEQLNPMWHTSRDRGGTTELDRDTIVFTALAAATWAYFLVTAGDQEGRAALARYFTPYLDIAYESYDDMPLRPRGERPSGACLDPAAPDMPA